jgi:hypothetical protein
VAAIVFNAPPTVAKFMKSEAFFRGIAGPVGSGKTTGCIFELFRRACEQRPGADGLRYTRFAILRQTLSQLQMTVLKDIMSWLKDVATWKVSEKTIFIEFGDVRSEWVLIPLENPEDQHRLLSSQLTGAWLSEAIEMDVDLVAPIAGRCGRYPSAQLGVPTWFGIIADTNFPAEGSDWHKTMAIDIPPDWQWFLQPGGMDPAAENLEYLVQTEETIALPESDPRRKDQGRKYYQRLLGSKSQDWVRRYVHAQYGDDPSGTAVFRESFKMGFHVLDEVLPVHGIPLIVGQDFGRDPWAIITQMDHKGRLRVLGEVRADDIGLEQHLRIGLRPTLNDARYLGRPIILVGDPAGRSKDSLYEETSFDLLKRAGFMAYPAPTNDIDPRLRAVEVFLLGQRDGGPMMLIDRQRCPHLVRALAGGYRYAKTRAGVRKATPDKTGPGAQFSHVADALEYACLAHHGGMGQMMAARLTKQRTPRARMPTGAWT